MPTPNRRYQFSLFSMMLLMLVATVLGGVGARMRAATESGVQGRVIFVFFTLLAPMLLLVVLTAGRQVWLWWDRSSRR